MVHPVSHRVSRVPWYLGVRSGKTRPFRAQGSHLLRPAFPDHYAIGGFCNFLKVPPNPPIESHNPWHTTPTGLHTPGLGCSPFARRYWGNRDFFLFLEVLRCFTSLRSPHTPMYSVHDAGVLTPAGCPIRKSPGLSACLTASRGLSQLTTSFIASLCQGIH